MMTVQPSIPWLLAGADFPDLAQACARDSAAPGLLAAGGALDTNTLIKAYAGGIFPWFSEGQPLLWWSPDPRMVLKANEFRLHHSFKKTLDKFQRSAHCEVKMDTAFEQVINSCASQRASSQGTWILPEMIAAYLGMYQAGFAHSVETWIDGELVGGLYCIAIGKAVFGESMFSRSPNASKTALAGLVAFCRAHNIQQIDCQQNTSHLASLGAREISRTIFVKQIVEGTQEPAPDWIFDKSFWQLLKKSKPIFK